MNEYLVNIRIEWPDDIPQQKVDELSGAERMMAAGLAKEGHLVRMWRVPGRRENWGLWRAQDPTQLHDILSALPVWPYMDLTVHALAKHPVDPA